MVHLCLLISYACIFVYKFLDIVYQFVCFLQIEGSFSASVIKNDYSTKNVLSDDPIDVERRQKVKEAMLHAWSSYENNAWGQDELQVHDDSENNFCWF